MHARPILILLLLLTLSLPIPVQAGQILLEGMPHWKNGGSEPNDNLYTQFIPWKGSGEPAKTGETALAVAKVVKYWSDYKYLKSTKQYTYESPLGRSVTCWPWYYVSGYPFDFEAMPDKFNATHAPGNLTTARLISTTAWVLSADFYRNSTVDWDQFDPPDSSLLKPLVYSFNYTKAEEFSNVENWMEFMKEDLTKSNFGRGGSPVILRLSPNNVHPENHVVVVDGWRDDTEHPMVHINLPDGSEKWMYLGNNSFEPIGTYGWLKQSIVNNMAPMADTLRVVNPAPESVTSNRNITYVFHPSRKINICQRFAISNHPIKNSSESPEIIDMRHGQGASHMPSEVCFNGTCSVPHIPHGVDSYGGLQGWGVIYWNCSGESPFYVDQASNYTYIPTDLPTAVDPPFIFSSTYTGEPMVHILGSKGMEWYGYRWVHPKFGTLESWHKAEDICTPRWDCSIPISKLATLHHKTGLMTKPSYGTHFFFVRGWAPGNLTPWSKPVRHDAHSGEHGLAPRNVKVDLYNKNGTVYSATPTLTWDPDKETNKTWFNIWIGSPTSPSSWNEFWISQNKCSATQCNLTAWVLNNGETEAYVGKVSFQASFHPTPGYEGSWVTSSYHPVFFDTQAGLPAQPTPIYPRPNDIPPNFNPVFRWNKDRNASWQGLTLYKDGAVLRCSEGANCYNGQYWIDVSAQNTSWCEVNSSKMFTSGLQDGTYEWKLQSWGAGAGSSVAEHSMGKFTLKKHASTRAVNLRHETTSNQNDMCFKWDTGNSMWYGVVFTSPTGKTSEKWELGEKVCIENNKLECSLTLPLSLFSEKGSWSFLIKGWNPNDGKDLVTSERAWFEIQ